MNMMCVYVSLGNSDSFESIIALHPCDPFYKVWDEITYPFLNFSGCTIEV